jgi:anionic cell wall polymer biosynthesis LytR-Cps2A-Psr (LCP) family protein
VIDNTTERYGFFQVDRNSMADVPVMSDDGEFDDIYQQQICTAHWYGLTPEDRNENVENALTPLMGGLEIYRYFVMNMKDIGKVNDAIGGVTVTIPTDMTAVDPAFKEGAVIHLTGDQAEEFVRARTSLEDDTNEARMSRQEQYLENAYTMVLERLKESPEFINDIYDSLQGVFETDGNGRDISRITNQIVNYESMGFNTFDGKVKIGNTIDDGLEHEECYVDEASILEQLSKVIDLREDDTSSDDTTDNSDEDIFIDPDDIEK